MDLIEEYLNAKLISAQTEEELQKIEASVGRFAKVLAHQPMRLPAALQVTTVPTASICQGILDEVHLLVRQEWRTIASRYPERPTELLRVVVLAAVISLARDDESWADAVGLLLPTLVPFLDGDAKDVSIWQRLIDEFQGGYERRAEDMWSVPASINLPEFELSKQAATAMAIGGAVVSADCMAVAIADAFTDTYEGKALENGNPHQIVHGTQSQWADHASKRLGSLLAGNYAKSVRGEISGPGTKALVPELETYIADVVELLTAAVHGQDLSTRLLWWKESSYSPMSQLNYRDIAPERVAIQAALDLAQWLPNRTPPSAFYFLQGAVDSFVADPNKEVSLDSYSLAAVDLDLSSPCNDRTGSADAVPLTAVLDQKSSSNWSMTVFEKDTTMKPAMVAEHVLREILADRVLAGIKPARKPRAS